MASRRRPSFDDLPLFANDREIAAALVGPERASEIVAMFPIFERQGFPKVDQRFAGRYVPAVRRFLDADYGLAAAAPSKPDGREDLSAWRKPKKPQG